MLLTNLHVWPTFGTDRESQISGNFSLGNFYSTQSDPPAEGKGNTVNGGERKYGELTCRQDLVPCGNSAPQIFDQWCQAN